MITENLSTLEIHQLSKDQYKRLVDEGKDDENALYLTPDDAAHMVVTINGDKASHSAIEINNHVQAGGTVVAQHGGEYYYLNHLDTSKAQFTTVQDDAFLYGCMINDDNTVQWINIELAKGENIVRFDEQTLTPEQQAQARANIGITGTGADGKDGSDGADGISPTVAVSKSGKVTTISITDKNGTKTATINDGADGSNGSNGKDGTSVTVKSVSESTVDGGSNVVTFSDGKTVAIKNGSKGSAGTNGSNGVSATHSWSGTTLTITSASGTSSANLKGEKGDKGDSVKGDKGDTGAAGVSVSSVKQTTTSSADGGSNVVTVTLSNGTTSTFTVKNGSKGSAGAAGKTPVKGADYWTEADQEAIVQQVITALGTPVFGRVDADNNIILTGELVDGTYTIKYEDAEGNVTEIGTYTGGRLGDVPITPVWHYPYKLDSSTGVANADSGNTYAYSDGIPFIEGTELYISCEDTTEFHAHWYYYDANDNFVGKTDWAVGTTTGTVTPKPETVISQKSGAAVVKLRCNVAGNGHWHKLDRLTIFRRYL